MAELMEFKVEGFDELTKKMFVRLPKTVERMAGKLDANMAVGGRIRDLKSYSGDLHLGKPQWKSLEGPGKVYTRWEPNVGWTSTTSRAKGGKTGRRMANFKFYKSTGTSVTVGYGNQLANLWSKPTKPYGGQSPLFSSNGKTFSRWGIGKSRTKVLYNWSTVISILNSIEPAEMKRTEIEFQKELNKI